MRLASVAPFWVWHHRIDLLQTNKKRASRGVNSPSLFLDRAGFRQLSLLYLLIQGTSADVLIILFFVFIRVAGRSFCPSGHRRGDDGQRSDRKNELGQRFEELYQWQELEQGNHLFKILGF